MKFMRAQAGHTVKPEVNILYAGANWARPITGSAGAVSGQTVCKSGFDSKCTCTVVGGGRTTAFYSGHTWQDVQMAFQPMSGVFARGGDSGGAVFIDQTAGGTIAAGNAQIVFFTWIHATAYLQGVTMVI